MTTLLVRTRSDAPFETAPPVAASCVDTAAPAPELPESPAVPPPTVTNLLAYYLTEVLPTHAPTTQYQRTRFLAMMDRQYGQLPLTAITPAWQNP